MSWDIDLIDPITRETIVFDFKHHTRGATYKLGGDDNATLNVTYNYSPFYKKVFGEKGITILYGMTGTEAIPLLNDAISKLKDDATNNYFDPTEGNAKRALCQLRALAQLRPDGIFDGD